MPILGLLVLLTRRERNRSTSPSARRSGSHAPPLAAFMTPAHAANRFATSPRSGRTLLPMSGHRLAGP